MDGIWIGAVCRAPRSPLTAPRPSADWVRIDFDEKAEDQDEAKQVAVSARSLAEGRARFA